MNDFAVNYPDLFMVCLAAFVVFVWMAISLAISLLSGWRALAEDYRTERPFPTHRRWMQSARMRASARYGNILTLGSDAEGIYIGVFLLFRIGHPRLFVPWKDVQVEEPKRRLFVMMQTLRLGPKGIPLQVREPAAQFMLEARETSGGTSKLTGMKWGI